MSSLSTRPQFRAQNKSAFKIAISSGKGGVGKTSISLKMCKTLTELGYKTLLIDCDYNLSNTAIKLGLPVGNHFWELLNAQKTFDECLFRDGNFHLLPACNGHMELFDSQLKFDEIILDIIQSHENDYDFILLDNPAGMSRETCVLSAYCDERIIIVTPDRSSIMDSYSLVKVLKNKFSVKQNHLLVNMYLGTKQFQNVVKTFSETAENFLQVRTCILGGVRKIDFYNEEFDQFFLNNKENPTHQEFHKVLKNFTDSIGKGGESRLKNIEGNLIQPIMEMH